MRLKRILEIGGLSGYSATNFLKAFATPGESMMYTVDLNPVPVLASNHKVIVKDAQKLVPSDVDQEPIDLIFFDSCMTPIPTLFSTWIGRMRPAKDGFIRKLKG